MVSARAMVKCGKVHHLRTRVYVTMDEGFLWNCPSVKETKKELPLMMVKYKFYLDPRHHFRYYHRNGETRFFGGGNSGLCGRERRFSSR